MRLEDLANYDQVVLYGMGLNGKDVLAKAKHLIKGELLLFDKNPGEFEGYTILQPDFSMVKGNHIVVVTPTINKFVSEMFDNVPQGLNVYTLFNFEGYEDGVPPDISIKLPLGFCTQCLCETTFTQQMRKISLDGINSVGVCNDSYCDNCGAILRERSTIDALNTFFPNWKNSVVHESSPRPRRVTNMERLMEGYVGKYSYSYFYPNIPLGEKLQNGGTCENLEALTFADESIDYLITTDVFEHVYNPLAAFESIARILKPGGAHVFTIPYNKCNKTCFRAKTYGDKLIYLDKPVYHGSPIDDEGCIVTVDWGYDICKYIYEATGGKLKTVIYDDCNTNIGSQKSPEEEGDRKLLISARI